MVKGSPGCYQVLSLLAPESGLAYARSLEQFQKICAQAKSGSQSHFWNLCKFNSLEFGFKARTRFLNGRDSGN